MGRVRGKAKKQAAPSEDLESGEEVKAPVKRRGRPQKHLKDDTDDEEIENLEDHEEDGEKMEVSVENGRKRNKPSHVKENGDSAKEENGVETRAISNNSLKSVGFRQNGSRRKNSKPQRAAEVGVECK